MFWRFLTKDKNHRTTFRLSKMVHESGSYKHNLDAYQIVPLANDTELTDKLPFKRARARYNIIANELPERATRFSSYLGSVDTDATLDGLQSWIRLTAELSTESDDRGLRPHPFRPRLRAIHFDAACFAHDLAVEELVIKNDRWNAGFAGDAPLFQRHANLPVFPVLWSKADSSVHVNIFETIRHQAANTVLGGEQMAMSQWLAQLNTVSPTIHPVEQLRQMWQHTFEEENGHPPGFNDLLEMAHELRIHTDDVPKDILEEAGNRPDYGGDKYEPG